MINYNLICQDCEYEFKSWFASSKEFSKLQKKNLLECIKCESKNVTKGIMAPNISSKLNSKDFVKNKQHEMKTMARSFNKYIEKNFENVGDRFPEEARMAINGIRDDKIYGECTDTEAQQLREEGIPVANIPKYKDDA
jgi:hypothetical protein